MVAHFDREAIIFVQLSGHKRWTFFHPTQLSDLCMYPYAHPALRSLQADIGNNVGIECERSKGLHNRSITLNPGDLLIVGPYHVHRVEAIDDSIS